MKGLSWMSSHVQFCFKRPVAASFKKKLQSESTCNTPRLKEVLTLVQPVPLAMPRQGHLLRVQVPSIVEMWRMPYQFSRYMCGVAISRLNCLGGEGLLLTSPLDTSFESI